MASRKTAVKKLPRSGAESREAFPDMSGLSSRNLKYMRAFAAAWPDEAIVQGRLHKLTWYHHLALLEKLNTPEIRLWYAERAFEQGWSRNTLVLHIERRLHERQGKAQNNEWETKLVDELPKALRGSLPTVEEIEAELGGGGAGEMVARGGERREARHERGALQDIAGVCRQFAGAWV